MGPRVAVIVNDMTKGGSVRGGLAGCLAMQIFADDLWAEGGWPKDGQRKPKASVIVDNIDGCFKGADAVVVP